MLSQSIVAFVLKSVLSFIEIFDLFIWCVDVQDLLLLAIFHQHLWRHINGKVHAKTWWIDEDFVQYSFVVLMIYSYFKELDLFVCIWKMKRVWVNDSDFIKCKVSLDQGDCCSSNGSVPNNTYLTDKSIRL